MVEPSFQAVNRIFLVFENDAQKTSHSGYHLPNAELKNCNIMINGESLLNQPVKSNKVTYENIRKFATVHRDDYTTACFLDYPYFKDSYKIIAVDLIKQQALDADPRANKQIHFTANLDITGNTSLEESRETKIDFSQGTIKVL